MSHVIRATFSNLLFAATAAMAACSSAASSSEDASPSADAPSGSDGKEAKVAHLFCPPATPKLCDGVCVTQNAPCGVTKPPPATVDCGFSPTCPPDEYNTTAAGYASGVTMAASGCSFAPPASCQTGTSGANAFPALTAPVVTSVVIGQNTVYAIGVPSTPITTLPTGGAFADTRSAVFAWGDNSAYQLGDGTTQASTTPQVPFYDPNNGVLQIAAGVGDACALLADHSVRCWGTIKTDNDAPIRWPIAQPVAFPPGTSIAQITHGDNHACALTAGPNPLVYCWGNNDAGQLGQPPSVTAANNYFGGPLEVPLAAATAETINGQLPGAVVSVVASGDSTCVLAHGIPSNAPGAAGSSEGVYCWGSDSTGSLGDGAGTPESSSYLPVLATPLPDGFVGNYDFSALTGGGGSFCAIAGSLGWTCWGADDQGQIDIAAPALQNGESPGILAPTQITDTQFSGALALGANHSCAAAYPFLYCFGDNDSGQIGVSTGVGSGMDLISTEASAPPATFPSTAYTGFAVGENMTCGIYVSSTGTYGTPTATGNIACWGGDSSGLVSSYAPTFLDW